MQSNHTNFLFPGHNTDEYSPCPFNDTAALTTNSVPVTATGTAQIAPGIVTTGLPAGDICYRYVCQVYVCTYIWVSSLSMYILRSDTQASEVRQESS